VADGALDLTERSAWLHGSVGAAVFRVASHALEIAAPMVLGEARELHRIPT